MSPNSHDARREQFRLKDGRFGVQPHDRAEGVDLYASSADWMAGDDDDDINMPSVDGTTREPAREPGPSRYDAHESTPASVARMDKLRGHALVPASADDWPKIYDTEDVPMEDTPIQARYFTPSGSATWLVSEYDPDRNEAFGYTDLYGDGQGEWGYFSMTELGEATARGTRMPAVERDLHFEQGKLAEDALWDEGVMHGRHAGGFRPPRISDEEAQEAFTASAVNDESLPRMVREHGPFYAAAANVLRATGGRKRQATKAIAQAYPAFDEKRARHMVDMVEAASTPPASNASDIEEQALHAIRTRNDPEAALDRNDVEKRRLQAMCADLPDDVFEESWSRILMADDARKTANSSGVRGAVQHADGLFRDALRRLGEAQEAVHGPAERLRQMSRDRDRSTTRP